MTPTRAEFDPLALTYGYTYRSGAVVGDGELPLVTPDTVSIYTPTTAPGASVPSCDVRRFNGKSTIEALTGNGHFTLIVGEGGAAWREAAQLVAAARGVALEVVSIGERDTDWVDWRFDWTRHREVSSAGAVLVRPDRFVAWRQMSGGTDLYTALDDAFVAILGHPGE